MRNIRMYIRFSLQNIRGLLEYKNDFLISTFAGTIMQTFGLIFLFVLFGNIQAIGGWLLYEVALLYGCVMAGEGVLTFLFQGTGSLNRFVRTGQFDRYMLRPLPLTTQLLGATVNFAGLGTLVTSIALIAVAISRLNALPSPWMLVLFIFNILLGIVIRININLSTASMAFLLIEAGGFNAFIYNTQDFAKYPITIYPLALQVILLTILPHAMISFIPTCLLLSKLPVWPCILLVPASLVFTTFLRRTIFRNAVKKYESAGN